MLLAGLVLYRDYEYDAKRQHADVSLHSVYIKVRCLK